MSAVEPIWLQEARKHIGLREIPGAKHNTTISKWLTKLKAWWRDDETPWCGTFVAHCVQYAGLVPPKEWYRARSWADWGTPTATPRIGCIVVFERKGGGHVGFVVGEDTQGRLLVLGGNQGDAVSIAPFDKARVLCYRIPPNYLVPHGSLPVFAAAGESSTNEA